MIEDVLNAISNEYFGEYLPGQSTGFHVIHILHGKGNYKWHAIEQRINPFKRPFDVIASHGRTGRVVIRLDPSKMVRQDYQSMAFMYVIRKSRQPYVHPEVDDPSHI